MQHTVDYHIGLRRLLLALLCGVVLAPVSNLFAQVDLKLARHRTATTLSVEKMFFSQDDCSVAEGCVGATGWRTLLRFDVAVVNVGRRDLRLGNPTDAPQLYEWSPCHEHFHYRALITYELFTLRGRLVRRGSKQAFCLRDNYPYLDNAPASRGYDCENQGLTWGWQDVYDKSLDCQWIDITGIRPGTYVLRATVNRNRRLREGNYKNNAFTLRITIPKTVAEATDGDSEHPH
jgi:hypothetical protein